MALSLKGFIGADTSGFEAGIDRATKKAKGFDKEVSALSFLKRFLGVAAVAQFTKSIVDLGSSFLTMAKRTETSTDAIQQWIFAAKQNQAKGEDVISFFERLGQAREDALGGNEALINSFAKFGVSMKDLRELRVEQLGLKIGNAIKAGDAQQLIGSLKDVGGKGAGALVAAFKNGLEELFKDAPLIKSKDILDLAAAGSAFDALILKIKVTFAPLVSWLSKWAQDVVDGVQVPFRALFSMFKGVFTGDMEGAKKEAYDWMDKAIKDHTNRWKEKEPAATPPNVPFSSESRKKDRFRDSMKEPTQEERLKAAMNGGGSRNLNAMQQVGAFTAFNPMKSEMANLTAELRRVNGILNYLKNKRIPGMTATTSGSVQF